MGFGKSNLDDLRSRRFYTALVAEFLGTLLLVLVGCGAVENYPASYLHISIAFGLSVASIVWAIANVSGGHINPAVTIGFLVTRRISLVRALLYMVVQTVGAIVGAGLLKALTPQNSGKVTESLGAVGLNGQLSQAQGFGVELLISFIFIFVIFSAVDSQRGDTGGSIPLTIGLTIAMCHLWAIPFTGSAMNPARSLGPAVILGSDTKWSEHWIYWVGPLIGGALGGFLYDFVFAVNATPAKIKGYFTTADYDNDHYDKTGRRSGGSDATEMKP